MTNIILRTDMGQVICVCVFIIIMPKILDNFIPIEDVYCLIYFLLG